MTDPGWYPPSQVCYPPELPAYLKHVYDLKPIAGVPRDAEVIGIHSVVHAASRVSAVPGMHDSNLFMKLADHLFSVQMARYRSRYSLITFPSDATYTPPTLPALVSINLEAVSGAPSDEEIMKVQDAVRAYQNLITVPSVFDPRVNMELSQHLFDLQMARHMRLAGETQPSLESQASAQLERPVRPVEQEPDAAEETTSSTNNAGAGGNEVRLDQTSQLVPGIVRELMERSNQLAERFNQALDQFSRLAEQTPAPSAQSDPLAERFTQLSERFNQIVEQSNRSAQQVNQLAERSDQLLTQLGQSSTRSNQLAEQANKEAERFGVVMKNINRVLVGIQHAIVRSYRGNSVNAVHCLVNEAGEALGMSKTAQGTTFKRMSDQETLDGVEVAFTIDSVCQYIYIEERRLGELLRFFGIGDGLCVDQTSATLIEGRKNDARDRLTDYFDSCFG